MNPQPIPGGTVHALPPDLRKVLAADAALLVTWNDITPLARNEWICLVESAKLPETRIRRTSRMVSQMTEGQRRPCCWEGCPHREKTGEK